MEETGRRDLRRRLDQLSHNPGCVANVRASLGGVAMVAVAQSLGLDAQEGQSPFAITRGISFEKSLFDEDAARLRLALVDKGVLPADTAGFVDLRPKINGGPLDDLDASREAFLALLRGFAHAVGSARLRLPGIIAGPTLRLGGGVLPEGRLALDVVTVHPAPEPHPVVLRVGEMKVYPDRGGYTDPSELASARAQAGLYLYALRREITAAGLDGALAVADDGFLVLTRPTYNLPSVRAHEDLRYQAERAAVLLAQAEALAPRVAEAPSDPAQAVRWVAEAPRNYGSRCMEFCPMAPRCHREALAAQVPAALGDDLAQRLGEVSLDRAAALLRGDSPVTEAERALAARLP